MKKVVALICMIVCLVSCIVVFAADDIEIYLFGKEVECDVAPVIENGRTLVPVRVISEKGMGAKVHWDGKKKNVTIKKDDLEVILTIGDERVIVNGEEAWLDVPAKLISDRTMVPIRFVGETYNYLVDWDGDNRRVLIDKKEEPKDMEDGEDCSKIEKIVLEETDNDNLLNVTVSPYTEPDIFTLKEPYRIVVDLKGAISEDHDDKIETDSPYVKQVRYANHEGFYRIVVECHEEQPYKCVQTGVKDFSIIIGNSSTKTDLSDILGDSDEEEDKKDKENKEDEERVPNTAYKENMTVIIDAGHGGKDPGALARDEEGEVIYDEDNEVYIKEKDINLTVAKMVYKYLDERKVNVVMTRSKDKFLELREIADIANEENGALFVSIHCNSVDGNSVANGTEVLYFNKVTDEDYNISSEDLADNIMDSIADNVDTFERGLKERPGLAVLKWTDMPAALVELGFLTNMEDQERLLDEDWQATVAKAIAEGIIDSLEQMKD